MSLKVCSSQCKECLFSPNKIVSDARKREIIQTCLATGAQFTCHKATIKSEEIVCRGFYDTYGPQINLIRIAQRLHAIEEVDIEQEAGQLDDTSKHLG